MLFSLGFSYFCFQNDCAKSSPSKSLKCHWFKWNWFCFHKMFGQIFLFRCYCLLFLFLHWYFFSCVNFFCLFRFTNSCLLCLLVVNELSWLLRVLPFPQAQSVAAHGWSLHTEKSTQQKCYDTHTHTYLFCCVLPCGYCAHSLNSTQLNLPMVNKRENNRKKWANQKPSFVLIDNLTKVAKHFYNKAKKKTQNKK